jgi:predicted acyltransferase
MMVSERALLLFLFSLQIEKKKGIAMSMTRLKEGRLVALLRVLKRSAKLIALGLFLNNMSSVFTSKGERLPGVLQRFGVAYFFTSCIALFASFCQPRTPANIGDRGILVQIVLSTYSHMFEWACGVVLITIWLLVTFLLPVPGCPTGYLGPGGIGDQSAYCNCTGGAAAQVDRVLLGETHIYQQPTCHLMYFCGPYDPEGILGNLTSIALCLLGLQVRVCMHLCADLIINIVIDRIRVSRNADGHSAYFATRVARCRVRALGRLVGRILSSNFRRLNLFD